MPRSTSPTVSCLSEEKVRISPLCCNILYPKVRFHFSLIHREFAAISWTNWLDPAPSWVVFPLYCLRHWCFEEDFYSGIWNLSIFGRSKVSIVRLSICRMRAIKDRNVKNIVTEWSEKVWNCNRNESYYLLSPGSSLSRNRLIFPFIFKVLRAFMNFMSFNWPRQNRISNYNVARVIPIFLLSPTITNMVTIHQFHFW